MSNKIRKLILLEAIPFKNEQGQLTGALLPLSLIVGVEHSIIIDENTRPIKRKICEISETKKGYDVFLENDQESQLWKKIPKNQNVIIEFSID